MMGSLNDNSINQINTLSDLLSFEDENFIIIRFPVLHNIETFGFAIFCKEEQKTMLFMTDFVSVLEKSIYNLKVDFLAIELSYNEFLLKNLTDDQKYGLKWEVCESIYLDKTMNCSFILR